MSKNCQHTAFRSTQQCSGIITIPDPERVWKERINGKCSAQALLGFDSSFSLKSRFILTIQGNNFLLILIFTLVDGTGSSKDENVPDATPPQETNDHNESPSAAEVQRSQNINLFKNKTNQTTKT